MAIRTVLSVLDARNFEQDLQSAVDFCRNHDAHLTALLLSFDADFYITEYQVYSEIWVKEQQRILGELAGNAAMVRESLATSGASFEVNEILTQSAWAEDKVAENALYSDVVLFGRQAASDGELLRRTIGGALFRSPTPILFNRAIQPVSSTIDTVVVGWDSGDAAARSIRNGLQFLKAASSVHITMIDPIASVSENGEEPGADVARFLSRHAIRVEVDVLPSGGKKVGEVLRQHATDVGAGLVVMGAYQHSRIQERLFGGVTKSMLHQSDIALFLSH